ncbi:efflux RND transporter periplasmic adaptor subunit [Flavobacterium sp. I3-2]|uniref:efflux RND transporter periplasmic adaptor subunit n=1 Tax=Flavobacterium sp. I3-2 TaxID=2748319 RepID=UPI0015A937FA|nr:efflux RND transporter periplasmic adaptor subunit [Flavobacterium sp. I3-2]
MKKYIGILLSLIVLSSCTNKTENQTVETKIENKIQNQITLSDTQLQNIDLQITRVEKGIMPTTIRLNARTATTPQDQISITNMLGGFVKSIPVLPGNLVKKGQIVAILEDPSYVQLQEDYLTTKALITKANADYLRQKELNEAQAASTKVLDEAKAELNLLQIKKRALEEKLKLIDINPNQVSLTNLKRSLSITAPTSGIVTEIYVNRGKYVSSSEPILEIIQTGAPMLNIKAFENSLALLKIGQELEAYTNTNVDEKITAKIVSISQHINTDGSVDVLAKIVNPNQMKFTTNMYFNVELTSESNSADLLPEASVIHFEGNDYVFEMKSKNNFQLIPVKIGTKSNGKIQITSQLDTSKQYVGKGAYAILMAMKNSPEAE